MLAQGEEYASPSIPTSDPRDSDHVYAQAAQPGPSPLYDAYTAMVSIPYGVTIQPATITYAPRQWRHNPEWADSGQSAFQDAWRQVAAGAPPIPRTTPRYAVYEAQRRPPAPDYREIIDSVAPRPSDGSGYTIP